MADYSARYGIVVGVDGSPSSTAAVRVPTRALAGETANLGDREDDALADKPGHDLAGLSVPRVHQIRDGRR